MAISWRTSHSLTYAADAAAPYADVAFAGMPTNHTTGDLLIPIASVKPVATTIGGVSGYSAVCSVATSSGQSIAADTGDVRVYAWSKIDGGSESAPTMTFDGAYNPALGAILNVYAAAGPWVTGATATDDTATGTGISATGPSMTWAAGDNVVVISAGPSNTGDTGQESSVSVAIANCTIGSVTERLPTNTSGMGLDGSIFVYSAEVTSGGTGAVTFTATSGTDGSSQRAVLLLNLSETAPTTNIDATTVAAVAAIDGWATRNALIVPGGESKQGIWT